MSTTWDTGYRSGMRLPVPDPRDLSKALLGAPERVLGLLDSVERVLDRVEALVGRIEVTRGEAEAVVRRAARVVTDVEPLVRRVGCLLDGLERPLVEEDLLPLLSRMGSVAPDLHDLLAASQELNQMLGGLPGMGRIRRRLDEEHEAAADAPAAG